MSKINAVTTEEKERIISMLKSGMIGEQIAEETGRSQATIGRIRKELRKDGFDIWGRGSVIAESIPVANTEAGSNQETRIPEMQLAPSAPREEETKTAGSTITMKSMSVKFAGSKTGFVYELVAGSDDLCINNEGKVFRIKRTQLEQFGEELLDVVTQVMLLRGMM